MEIQSALATLESFDLDMSALIWREVCWLMRGIFSQLPPDVGGRGLA